MVAAPAEGMVVRVEMMVALREADGGVERVVGKREAVTEEPVAWAEWVVMVGRRTGCCCPRISDMELSLYQKGTCQSSGSNHSPRPRRMRWGPLAQCRRGNIRPG